MIIYNYAREDYFNIKCYTGLQGSTWEKKESKILKFVNQNSTNDNTLALW